MSNRSKFCPLPIRPKSREPRNLKRHFDLTATEAEHLQQRVEEYGVPLAVAVRAALVSVGLLPFETVHPVKHSPFTDQRVPPRAPRSIVGPPKLD